VARAATEGAAGQNLIRSGWVVVASPEAGPLNLAEAARRLKMKGSSLDAELPAVNRPGKAGDSIR